MVIETGAGLFQVVRVGGDDDGDKLAGINCIDVVPAELRQGIILAQELPLQVSLVNALGNARVGAAVCVSPTNARLISITSAAPAIANARKMNVVEV